MMNIVILSRCNCFAQKLEQIIHEMLMPVDTLYRIHTVSSYKCWSKISPKLTDSIIISDASMKIRSQLIPHFHIHVENSTNINIKEFRETVETYLRTYQSQAIEIRTRCGNLYFKTDDILAVSTHINSLRISLKNASVILKGITLAKFKHMLKSKSFFYINRSTFINLKFYREIQHHEIFLYGLQDSFSISRRRRKDFMKTIRNFIF